MFQPVIYVLPALSHLFRFATFRHDGTGLEPKKWQLNLMALALILWSGVSIDTNIGGAEVLNISLERPLLIAAMIFLLRRTVDYKRGTEAVVYMAVFLVTAAGYALAASGLHIFVTEAIRLVYGMATMVAVTIREVNARRDSELDVQQ